MPATTDALIDALLAARRDRIPADLAGLPVIYGGEPLLPHASMSRWIEARVRAAGNSPTMTR